jgi:arylsulfatase A-like enzyme
VDRPNLILVLTDQLRRPPAYESAELARFPADSMPGVERLRRDGVSFVHHYAMATVCAPSRAVEEKRLVPNTGEVPGYRPPLRRERVGA